MFGNVTSTRPCRTRTQIARDALLSSMALGTKKWRTEEHPMARPNSLFGGYLAARNPPGICVMKYPQNIAESTTELVAMVHFSLIVYNKIKYF